MKKQFISLCLSITIAGSVMIPNTYAFAATTNTTNTSSKGAIMIPPPLKLPTSPSEYEHQTVYANLNQSGLDNLVRVAEKAKASNTAANKLNLAATILTFVNGGIATTWCRVLTGASLAITSDLDAFGTVDYCYWASSKLRTGGYKYVKTAIPEQRFFNGDRYTSDWYPIKCPSAVSYHK